MPGAGGAATGSLAGDWEARDPTGRFSPATWRLSPLGDQRYRVEQVGFAAFAGTAVLAGTRLMVNFTTTTGYIGLGDFDLDATGAAAKGRILLAMGSAPQGEFPYELTRAGASPGEAGTAAPAATASGAAGVWDWSWTLNTGAQGASRVTLRPGGSVTCSDVPAAFGPIGSWWEEGGRVLVYWGGPFPRTNLHYVMTFALSGDGQRMATTTFNYYTRSIEGRRVSGMPPPGAADFGGVWDASDNGVPSVVVLTQVGDAVTGSYFGGQGRLEGVVAGRTLRCRWTLGGRSGTGEMTLSADGMTYSGAWTAPGEPGGVWSARRRAGDGTTAGAPPGPPTN